VEIASKMNAAAGSALTYTASVSDDDKITIAATGAFTLLPEGTDAAASILPEAGFEDDTASAASHEGDEITEVEKTITLTVEDDDGDNESVSRTLSVVSERADRLFSSDDKLRKHEADIMRFVPDGRASHKDVHRRVQTLILQWLDSEGFTDSAGRKITASMLYDISEVEDWATYMALKLIFEGCVKSVDDVFAKKAQTYESLEERARNRVTIQLVLPTGEITVPNTDRVDTRSGRAVRR
jgi:hypothetical protein